MKFIHLSEDPLTTFKKPKKLGKYPKPNGVLWVAKGNSWKEFVEEMEWSEKYKYEYEVDIEMSKIIKLNTYKDISEFAKKTLL